MAVQERHTQRLMEDPEVIGTAVTLGANGKPAILLLVTTERARAGAPTMLDGVPTKVEMTDKIVFWAVLLTALPALFWHAGYETARHEIKPIEKTHFLTGKTDPLLCQKPRRI